MRRRLKTVTLCHVRNQQFQMNNLTFFHFFIIHGSLKVYEGLLKSNGGIPLLSELRVLEAIAPDVLEVVKKDIVLCRIFFGCNQSVEET